MKLICKVCVHIGGVMLSVLEIEWGRSWVRTQVGSGQRKVIKIHLCCFSAVRSESNDCLARNQNKVSDCSRSVYMRTVISAELCSITIQLSVLVQYRADSFIINIWVSEWVSECCLTPTPQFFGYIIARTCYIRRYDETVRSVLDQNA
jgi:hypothetical protein